MRRVQNPTLRLSNNQIVGYVLISSENNPELRDQSNREGLIEGQALGDLRNLVEMILAELELRRYKLRHPKGPAKYIKAKGGIFVDFNLAPIEEFIKTRHSDDTELINLIEEKGRDLEKRVEEVQEVISRYRRLATLGQLIDTVLHDGRTPLAKIKLASSLGIRDVESNIHPSVELMKQLNQRFDLIHNQSNTLGTVFQKIEPFGGRKRGVTINVSLEKVIADAFEVLDSEIDEVGVRTSLPSTTTILLVDPSEIQQIIINLLQNSLYWLRNAPKGAREILIQVRPGIENQAEVIFSDNGPGVDPEFSERIFDPYVSTKPNGIGLGLTIAGEIINEYYRGNLELLDNGPLPGATFRFTLNNRG